MTTYPRTHLVLGLICLAFALFVTLVWVPLDTETGLIEKVRRQTNIGDALAPTVAAFFVGLGGLLLVLFERKAAQQPRITRDQLFSISAQIAIVVAGFVIMLYAGPFALALVDGDAKYRLLRDTAPWKYVGYFLGGTFIVSCLIAHAEGRFSWRCLLIGVAITLALIVVYDWPFDSLLLPPNGDF